METSSSWTLQRERVSQYVRRKPETTLVCRLVHENRELLEERWDELFSHTYGSLRKVVHKTFDKYLERGILEKGCVRVA